MVRPSCLHALTVKCVLDADLNPALPEGKDQQEAAVLHFLGRPECDRVGVFAGNDRWVNWECACDLQTVRYSPLCLLRRPPAMHGNTV